MDVGIVGLPGVGKTALFSALTGGRAASVRGGGLAAPSVGIVRVPDRRLATIASFITTQEVVPATIRVVDLPGFAAGAFARQVLAHIREVDAVCHVVRCHGTGIDPLAAIGEMETEVVFADLAVAEPALEKAARNARSGDREMKVRLASLEKILSILNEGRPIRQINDDLTDAERAAIRGFGMITAKPVLYVANVDEDDLLAQSSAAGAVRGYASEHGGESVNLCAQLEAELAELEPDDQSEMLESLGLEEPAAAVVARALYDLLGLMSFYTAGDKQVRAWPIRKGATAREAAGVVHTDMERGFIRAECYHVDDLVQFTSEKAIKEAGRLRSEGKNYHTRDGDVIHFLFNV